jgi:hypothetical protein
MMSRAILFSVVLSGTAIGWQNGSTARELRTPLDVETETDDGMTDRLAGAIYSAAAHSSLFVPTSDRKSGTIFVGIPPNPTLQEVGRRRRVTAEILIMLVFPGGQPVLSGKVTCWNDELNVCAAAVLKMAHSARDRN